MTLLDAKLAAIQGTGSAITVHRREQTGKLDHVYLSCLEVRFIGAWNCDASMHYRSAGDAEVRLVEANGVRRYFKFKDDSFVTLLPTNVLTFEYDSAEEVLSVDEDAQSGKGKNQSVL